MRVCLAVAALAGLIAVAVPAQETGPATEKRFPPLRVPAGFKATLFACDPLIEYPSVIAAGPRPGALWVAIDYMTGLGTEIVRRDEVRLVEDSDGDGYADRAHVFAQGFNSIQGLAYHDGTLYVMHAPFLTALRDTKGSGVADERRDLLTGLGLAPEKNPSRLHCANGVVVGHDGWLYLALGDNGIDVKRPEGDRLVLQGGGILRCRPDGRDLHVFATGLRNIYDIALDAELNVFVRDNENDGGTYMIRVCHSFHGADHGYPYQYYERPDEALAPLADLGRGSAAGGVCYLEAHFPEEYRGDLLFCEWGRALVRYQPRRSGSAFAPMKELEFATGAADDPYGFKPTDLVVQRDGTLMASDWCDGQRPKRGRGRIYRIAHAASALQAAPPIDGLAGALAQLDAASHQQRCTAQAAIVRLGKTGRDALVERLHAGTLASRARLHAVWALVQVDGVAAIDELVRLARTGADAAVRAQAVRALADLGDPVLTEHRLETGRGSVELAERLAELGKGQDPSVRREVVVALGRLRWPGTAGWLKDNLGQPDTALAHAAMQALRRSGPWAEVVKLLDEPEPLRSIALRAGAGQFAPVVVERLTELAAQDQRPARRREYGDALSRVYKKPGPWTYWGYRPGARPANTVAWDHSELIEEALDRLLSDPDHDVRLAVLERMRREQVPISTASLAGWLAEERRPERVAALLGALGEQDAAVVGRYMLPVVRAREHTSANRRAALALWLRGSKSRPLLDVAKDLEEGPVLADVVRSMGGRPDIDAAPYLLKHLKSGSADVRAAALAALGERGVGEARPAVVALLEDNELPVRRAAALAAGKLGAAAAADALLRLLADPDVELRRASLEALRRLNDARALAQVSRLLAVRELEATALEYLGQFGGPAQAALVVEHARRVPSAQVASAVVALLSRWRDALPSMERAPLDRAIAEVQGATGIPIRWHAAALPPAKVDRLERSINLDHQEGRILFAAGPEARVSFTTKDPATRWNAQADLVVPEAADVELLASSRGSLTIRLNGKEILRRAQPRSFQIDSDRASASLAAGLNRLSVEVGPGDGPAEFHLRLRRKSQNAARERLAQAALTRTGSAERGKQLFFDANKSLCLKCHRLGDQGERVGPELTGIGSRFARIYLVESILEPSRTIAPSYGSHVVTLKSGKLLTGIRVAEDVKTLTLADNQGETHLLAKADIDELQPSPLSTMPENLEQRFSETEFIDLIAFLESQKGAGR